jgi:hypothetical protein
VRTDDQNRHWAVEALTDLLDDDPDEAWRVVIELVVAADTEELLCRIGAGPLETLVTNHGERFISRIESAARSDAKFLTALSCVWASDASVSPRLAALVDPKRGTR